MGLGSSKSKRQSKCLIVGLDNSGKSTIVNYLKPERKRVKKNHSTLLYIPTSSFIHVYL